MTAFSKELANIMKSYLDSYVLKYDFDEHDGTFTFSLKLPGKIKRVIFAVMVGQNSYNVVGFLDNPDFEDMLIPHVTEFLHRINCICHESRFEFDTDGKTIACTQCINCKGVTPNKELILYTFSDIVFCIKWYGNGLVDIINKNGIPKEICDNYEKELLL